MPTDWTKTLVCDILGDYVRARNEQIEGLSDVKVKQEVNKDSESSVKVRQAHIASRGEDPLSQS